MVTFILFIVNWCTQYCVHCFWSSLIILNECRLFQLMFFSESFLVLSSVYSCTQYCVHKYFWGLLNDNNSANVSVHKFLSCIVFFFLLHSFFFHSDMNMNAVVVFHYCSLFVKVLSNSEEYTMSLMIWPFCIGFCIIYFYVYVSDKVERSIFLQNGKMVYFLQTSKERKIFSETINIISEMASSFL